MSAQRSEAGARSAHACGPRLFGVPVPSRAFGLTAGWCRIDRNERSEADRPSESVIAAESDIEATVVALDRSNAMKQIHQEVVAA